MNHDTINDEQILRKRHIKLLQNLDFGHIVPISDHQLPASPLESMQWDDLDYLPALSAKKNNITYFFDLVDNNLEHLTDREKPLKTIARHADKNWDIAFVLVTKYGNREPLESWCQERNLPISCIWEI